MKPSCAEDAEDRRVRRGGVEEGAGLEAEQEQEGVTCGQAEDGVRLRMESCFFLGGASSLSS